MAQYQESKVQDTYGDTHQGDVSSVRDTQTSGKKEGLVSKIKHKTEHVKDSLKSKMHRKKNKEGVEGTGAAGDTSSESSSDDDQERASLVPPSAPSAQLGAGTGAYASQTGDRNYAQTPAEKYDNTPVLGATGAKDMSRVYGDTDVSRSSQLSGAGADSTFSDTSIKNVGPETESTINKILMPTGAAGLDETLTGSKDSQYSSSKYPSDQYPSDQFPTSSQYSRDLPTTAQDTLTGDQETVGEPKKSYTQYVTDSLSSGAAAVKDTVASGATRAQQGISSLTLGSKDSTNTSPTTGSQYGGVTSDEFSRDLPTTGPGIGQEKTTEPTKSYTQYVTDTLSSGATALKDTVASGATQAKEGIGGLTSTSKDSSMPASNSQPANTGVMGYVNSLLGRKPTTAEYEANPETTQTKTTTTTI
eukprot:jgi/Mesen1/6969/ME000360S06222